MIGVGVYSLQRCETENDENSFKLDRNISNKENNSAVVTDDVMNKDMQDVELHHIPIWLIVAGILVVLVPVFYFIYDAFCKPEDVKQSK